MPDFFIFLTGITSALVGFAAIHRALHGLSMREFFLNLSSRPYGGYDLILFSVGLAYLLGAILQFCAAFQFPFVRDEWFMLLRRNLNVSINLLLVWWLLNGKLVERIYKIVERYAR